MSDAETLERLRRRMAKTENLQTLRAIGDQTSELAAVCADEMLNAVAGFQDRIADKIEGLGGKAVPRRPRCVVHNLASGSQIRMAVSPWVSDAQGILSRTIYNAEDGAPP
jgi:hypothetical protein